MPACRVCGQDNPEGAKFCLECGTPFAAAACPSCGADNPAGAKFCLECGTALAAAPAEPEVLPGEERKVVTALFTDIVGSTASAEQLDPEDVRARLAPYYSRVRHELESFGGTVEKFIGDAVVAVFGAPVAHEDDPERAVRAALAVREAVTQLNAEDEWLELHLRTAVHTGEALVVLDARASEGEGMAAGDVMNTAARLQGGAPIDGIVVGEATYRATADVFEYREAPPVEAKGKAEPIPIWEVLGEQQAPIRPSAETPLVGRVEELEHLAVIWQHTLASSLPQLAIVLGPPGIGKTRLLLALCEQVETDADVHWGRCLPYGEGMTYWPVDEILKSAAGILHDDEPPAVTEKLGALLERLPTENPDELRTMAAALANLIGVPTTPRGTYSADEISQAELHWGLRRVLQLLSRERPIVLVFEDLHWAEPTLLELISSIAHVDRAPILVIATARPEFRDMDPEFAHADTIRHVLELDALAPGESADFLHELVGSAGIREEAVEALLANAAGNPLFLEETVRMLADSGGLGADADLASMPVPDSLQALIGARLDALAAREKQVAQRASVVGGVFWVGAVRRLDGPGDVGPSLSELERRDFVHPRSETTMAGEREFAFKHILIRDVAYERLPKGRRAELHVRFSDWLVELTGTDDDYVEILAYHLEQACRLARSVAKSPVEAPVQSAVEALKLSAEKAERREGMREAARFYERALELVAADDAQALDLRLPYGRMLTALGDLRSARKELGAVCKEALARGRPRVRCAALIALANIDQKQGHAADARRRLNEASGLAVEVGDQVLEIRAGYETGTLRADFDGDHDAAVEQVRRGLSTAEVLGDRQLRVEGHLRLGFFLFQMGQLAAAEEELIRCAALASELGSFKDEARATFLLGLTKYYRGDVEDAERLALQTRDWLERTSDSYFQIQNLARALAVYALAKGDPVRAEEWLREAVPLALDSGGWLVLETYRYLVEALVRQGRLDDARELTEFAGRNVPEEDAYAQAELRIAQGLLASAEDDADAAVAGFAAAVELLEEQRLAIELGEARIAFARVLLQFGDEELAREQLALARGTFLPMDARSPLGEIERELARIGVGPA